MAVSGFPIAPAPREREVLDLLVSGRTVKQAAVRLGVSHKTVQVHRARSMAKLEADTMNGIIRERIRYGNR